MTEQEQRHTIAVLVDNEPGVLARVIGLFSGRGYNIDSLTVSETQHAEHLSRITVVTTGTPMVLVQIRNQLARLVPVHSVTDLTAQGRPLQRELALVKVAGTGEDRVESLRLASAYHAEVIDATTGHFVFQITGESEFGGNRLGRATGAEDHRLQPLRRDMGFGQPPHGDPFGVHAAEAAVVLHQAVDLTA